MSELSIDIGAIILAAGQGKRFGCPKIRAQINGRLFAEKIISSLNLAAVANYCLIASVSDAEFARDNFGEEQVLINPQIDSEMLDSLKIGVHHFRHCAGIIVWPVDFPLVQPSTIIALVQAFINQPGEIAKPFWNNLGGHPIILPKRMIPLILNSPKESTLHEIIQNSRQKINGIALDDEGVVQNLNHRDSDLLKNC